ncbi:MAG TPA: hypothetical protein VI248_28110 [Kineosporiaceae bacterium]
MVVGVGRSVLPAAGAARVRAAVSATRGRLILAAALAVPCLLGGGWWLVHSSGRSAARVAATLGGDGPSRLNSADAASSSSSSSSADASSSSAEAEATAGGGAPAPSGTSTVASSASVAMPAVATSGTGVPPVSGG